MVKFSKFNTEQRSNMIEKNSKHQRNENIRNLTFSHNY